MRRKVVVNNFDVCGPARRLLQWFLLLIERWSSLQLLIRQGEGDEGIRMTDLLKWKLVRDSRIGSTSVLPCYVGETTIIERVWSLAVDDVHVRVRVFRRTREFGQQTRSELLGPQPPTRNTINNHHTYQHRNPSCYLCSEKKTQELEVPNRT
jgi:hypothetical protein